MDERERERSENQKDEIDYGKTFIGLPDFGTYFFSLCIFTSTLRLV
jgi:hypothetical protein